MTGVRGEDEEQPFADVTLRMTVPAGIGRRHIWAELSNRFGDARLFIGWSAVAIAGRFREVTFGGQRRAVTRPAHRCGPTHSS